MAAGRDYRLAIVGGGPASVELTFASQIAIDPVEGGNKQAPGDCRSVSSAQAINCCQDITPEAGSLPGRNSSAGH